LSPPALFVTLAQAGVRQPKSPQYSPDPHISQPSGKSPFQYTTHTQQRNNIIPLIPLSKTIFQNLPVSESKIVELPSTYAYMWVSGKRNNKKGFTMSLATTFQEGVGNFKAVTATLAAAAAFTLMPMAQAQHTPQHVASAPMTSQTVSKPASPKIDCAVAENPVACEQLNAYNHSMNKQSASLILHLNKNDAERFQELRPSLIKVRNDGKQDGINVAPFIFISDDPNHVSTASFMIRGATYVKHLSEDRDGQMVVQEYKLSELTELSRDLKWVDSQLRSGKKQNADIAAAGPAQMQ
jgi:hypothetical protein